MVTLTSRRSGIDLRKLVPPSGGRGPGRLTVKILELMVESPTEIFTAEDFRPYGSGRSLDQRYRSIYNALYRLSQSGRVTQTRRGAYKISANGKKSLKILQKRAA